MSMLSGATGDTSRNDDGFTAATGIPLRAFGGADEPGNQATTMRCGSEILEVYMNHSDKK